MLRGNSEITSRNLEPVGNMTVHSLPSPSRSFCKPAASRPGWPSFRHPFAGRHSHRNRRRNPLRSPAGGGGGCRDPPAAGGAVGHGCAAGAGTAARFRTCRDGLALARAGRGQWLRRPDDGRAAAAGGRGPGRGRLAGLGCGWGPAGLPLRPDRSRRERATQDTLRLPFRCVSMQAGSRLAAVRPTQRLVRPQGVLAVLAVLLAERPRLVFTGRSAGDASMAALAALSLLRPFEWQLINVPMLPRGMAGICMAPIPYVVRHHMRSLSFAVLFCGVCFRPPIELRAGGCSSQVGCGPHTAIEICRHHQQSTTDQERQTGAAGMTKKPTHAFRRASLQPALRALEGVVGVWFGRSPVRGRPRRRASHADRRVAASRAAGWPGHRPGPWPGQGVLQTAAGRPAVSARSRHTPHSQPPTVCARSHPLPERPLPAEVQTVQQRQ